MAIYIALLRGINVGGHKPVKMTALRAALEEMGFQRVVTYLQSGNAVFGAQQAAPAALARSIERRLQQEFGSPIPVLVKTAREMQQLAAANPFAAQRGVDPAKLHVTFLFQAPTAAALGKLEALEKGRDQFRPGAGALYLRCLYLHCPDGYGRSKIANPQVERALSVAATTRNWKTVNELCRLAAQ